ncbi:ATP synthase gamma chain [bioreactor metagenome]|uniref:ATP synthase gamma chain n=1 Tax=bioreactor metagenome TaxID=1076179 RepID=A0A644T4C4_9ZZZZ
MSRPEEIRDRLVNVHQIGSIVSTLRATASAHQTEAKAHLQAIRAQEAAVAEALSVALALGGTAAPAAAGTGITIVIGAAQGFSGSYGERMAEAAHAAAQAGDRLMVVGSRTLGALADIGLVPDWSAEMAPHAPEVPPLAMRMADALFERLAATPEAEVRMIHADPDDIAAGPQHRSLFPLDTARFPPDARPAPMLNLPAQGLIAALIEEYVFTEICEGLMLGFAAENAARAEAMGRAQTAVKRIAGDLRQEFQRSRQEQMTTEIVELATAAEAVSEG